MSSRQPVYLRSLQFSHALSSTLKRSRPLSCAVINSRKLSDRQLSRALGNSVVRSHQSTLTCCHEITLTRSRQLSCVLISQLSLVRSHQSSLVRSHQTTITRSHQSTLVRFYQTTLVYSHHSALTRCHQLRSFLSIALRITTAHNFLRH